MEISPSLAVIDKEDLTKLLMRSGVASAATLALTGIQSANAAIVYQNVNQVVDNGTPSLNGVVAPVLVTDFLAPGTNIDASSTFRDPNQSASKKGGSSGNAWFNADSGLSEGYLGFSYADSGESYYGWANVSVSPYEVTVKDFAYESTPNTAIAAGDTGSLTSSYGSSTSSYGSSMTNVNFPSNPPISINAKPIPESSPVVGLMILGLGGIGVQISRQRQSRRIAQNQPQTPEVWEKLILGASTMDKN